MFEIKCADCRYRINLYFIFFGEYWYLLMILCGFFSDLSTSSISYIDSELSLSSHDSLREQSLIDDATLAQQQVRAVLYIMQHFLVYLVKSPALVNCEQRPTSMNEANLFNFTWLNYVFIMASISSNHK